MGGKGSSDSTGDQLTAYNNAYAAASKGQSLATILASDPGGAYSSPHTAGYNAWANSQFTMPEITFPSFSSSTASSGISYESMLKKQQEAAGIVNRDAAYSSYLDAAGAATDFVNSEIQQEQSNARLLGIDYEMNDEIKTKRISDYFASVWGEGDQTQLEGYMDQYGDPEGFEGFSIERGDGSKYQTGSQAEDTTVSTTGKKPTILQEEDEAGLGGQTSILGGV